MSRFKFAVPLAVILASPLASTPRTAIAEESGGVKLRHSSYLAKLVPASLVENQSLEQYNELTRQAFQKHVLLDEDDPQVVRLRHIQERLLPHSYKFNERAKDWHWEVNVINSKTINAFCMPGGKIAFFTGILNQLSLTDDEIAMVMGHEIAHALREHARERMAKSTITNYGSQIVGAILFGQTGQYLGAQAGSLLTLKFSRDDESEADLVGMELAARAGYDPRSGITLWQKMSEASRGAPPAWLSTHPSSASRILNIEKNLPDVLPLYEQAKASRAG
jgi:predicted Zn-dependent protease